MLFPLFVTIAVWFPALYDFAAGLVALAVACGVTVFFAHVARMRGRFAERRLFSLWGGKPTTIWLSHRDAHLDAHTTSRPTIARCPKRVNFGYVDGQPLGEYSP